MTWLLCDYGEVLSQPQPPAAQVALVAASGGEESTFWRGYWEHRGAYDRADLTSAEYWTRVLGHQPSPSVVRMLTSDDVASWLHPDRASVAAAVRAGQRGYRLAIFSNAPLAVADAIDQLPSLARFAPRLFSCRLREIKPDPAAFRCALDCLQTSPQEVVFFDDRQVNVDAASALGIRAHRFTNATQFDQLPAVSE